MSISNRLRHSVQRVDAHDLLRVLHHIATHGGVNVAELRDLTGLSKPTLMRMVKAARQQYGVVLSFSRSGMEYTIEDWGVFDPVKVGRFLSNDSIF